MLVLLCVLFLYIWNYITNCIFVFSIFYLAAFKKHYALRLAIAPEFFYCFICAYFICALWVAEIKYVCMYMYLVEWGFLVTVTCLVSSLPHSPWKRVSRHLCTEFRDDQVEIGWDEAHFCNYYFTSAAVAVDSSHMTASSSASWSRFSPPTNFVNGHVSTAWFMVCRWLLLRNTISLVALWLCLGQTLQPDGGNNDVPNQRPNENGTLKSPSAISSRLMAVFIRPAWVRRFPFFLLCLSQTCESFRVTSKVLASSSIDFFLACPKFSVY